MIGPLLGVAAAGAALYFWLGKKYSGYVGPGSVPAALPSSAPQASPGAPPLQTGNQVLQALGYTPSADQPYNPSFNPSAPVGPNNAPYAPTFVPSERPEYSDDPYTHTDMNDDLGDILGNLFGDDEA